MVYPRLFTPEEARKTLPLVRRIVADILTAARDLRALPEGDPGTDALAGRVQEYLQELETLGCYYKDWSYTVGLVDFPAVIDGETVFLCWRSDETELGWYHPLDTGYQGRTPLPAQPNAKDS